MMLAVSYAPLGTTSTPTSRSAIASEHLNMLKELWKILFLQHIEQISRLFQRLSDMGY